METEVRAPRAIHDDRGVVCVRYLSEPFNIGHRTEIARRNNIDAVDLAASFRFRGERLIERFWRQAVGYAVVGIHIRDNEGRHKPRKQNPVSKA